MRAWRTDGSLRFRAASGEVVARAAVRIVPKVGIGRNGQEPLRVRARDLFWVRKGLHTRR